LEYVIRKQSHDTAALFGLNDRGVIGVGKPADVNVIFMDALTLHAPRMAYDLPAGGHGSSRVPAATARRSSTAW
jgi:N-acyl-D-aspartate/D-glutamate deacylase